MASEEEDALIELVADAIHDLVELGEEGEPAPREAYTDLARHVIGVISETGLARNPTAPRPASDFAHRFKEDGWPR